MRRLLALTLASVAAFAAFGTAPAHADLCIGTPAGPVCLPIHWPPVQP